MPKGSNRGGSRQKNGGLAHNPSSDYDNCELGKLNKFACPDGRASTMIAGVRLCPRHASIVRQIERRARRDGTIAQSSRHPIVNNPPGIMEFAVAPRQDSVITERDAAGRIISRGPRPRKRAVKQRKAG